MKKGFTLIELLAVIIILALLMIVAVPNVLSTMNSAKKSTFVTQAQSIYKIAQQQWTKDSMTASAKEVYSDSGDPLDLSKVSSNVKYCVKFSMSGAVEKIVIDDGTYHIETTGTIGTLTSQILMDSTGVLDCGTTVSDEDDFDDTYTCNYVEDSNNDLYKCKVGNEIYRDFYALNIESSYVNLIAKENLENSGISILTNEGDTDGNWVREINEKLSTLTSSWTNVKVSLPTKTILQNIDLSLFAGTTFWTSSDDYRIDGIIGLRNRVDNDSKVIRIPNGNINSNYSQEQTAVVPSFPTIYYFDGSTLKSQMYVNKYSDAFEIKPVISVARNLINVPDSAL